MQPFSYTGLKIIHDQNIQEALEQHRLYAGQQTHRPGLLQMFGKFCMLRHAIMVTISSAGMSYSTHRSKEKHL